MLYVAMSEDIVARGVSQMLKKKPLKPKFKKPTKYGASGEDQAEQQQEEEQSLKEEANEEGVECWLHSYNILTKLDLIKFMVRQSFEQANLVLSTYVSSMSLA